VLSERGHGVSLVERSDRLGGALALAARTDETLDRFLGWLVRGVEQRPIEVRLLTPVTADLVTAVGADEVVVATGVRWTCPDVPGGDLPHVVTPGALRGWLDDPRTSPPGPRVVVLGGGKAGLSLAALAADRGHDVTIVEPTKVFGRELGLPGRFRLVHDVEERGVRLLGRSTLVSIDRDHVRVTGATGIDGEVIDIAADTVISTTTAPDTSLADALRSILTIPIHEISAATHLALGTAPPGGIEIAMAGAARVARAIA
jgi:NADPH-dependent 2,4-dienoyl-CoA reductase/sulfur reductase-like enzyme